MILNVLHLVLVFWIQDAVAQKGLQCFVPGECLDSQILGATPTNNSRECWSHCQSVTGCTWFTFYKDSQICTPLSGCLRLSNEKCQGNCISGEEECPEVQCGVRGQCYGALEGIRKVGSARECGSICKSHRRCFWNTYDPEHESCLMTNDCPLLDRSCTNCSSSEQDCDSEIETKVSSSHLLFGVDVAGHGRFFNLEKKAEAQCRLAFGRNPIGQYTVLNDTLLRCRRRHSRSQIIQCEKFHENTKQWHSNGIPGLKLELSYYLNMPDRGILLLQANATALLYNGISIDRPLQHSWSKTPSSTMMKQLPFCRAAISKDIFVVGFAPEVKKDQYGEIMTSFYVVNLRDNTSVPISLPNMSLLNSLCGVFGPDGNRKVAIFGGYYIENGKRAQAFDKLLIYNLNSSNFEVLDVNLRSSIQIEQGQTIGYEDTFVFYSPNKARGTSFYKFDINGTETKMQYLGSFPKTCRDLAVIPSDLSICN